LKKHVIDKVDEAGELLIRAAAVLGTLSEEERAALDEATDNQLTGCIGLALNAAKDVSASMEESLIRQAGGEGDWTSAAAEDLRDAAQALHHAGVAAHGLSVRLAAALRQARGVPQRTGRGEQPGW
jgi:hypothetical protein